LTLFVKPTVKTWITLSDQGHPTIILLLKALLIVPQLFVNVLQLQTFYCPPEPALANH
jgi:hypothetical protein